MRFGSAKDPSGTIAPLCATRGILNFENAFDNKMSRQRIALVAKKQRFLPVADQK